ncbi:uncharacterized protein LOC106659378 isoform X1 [Trichogramma pretiosum]|uniref:uncharacterized protein LOC106659378 isoform X1 n=1 Tax=Trichogramma pretiosum TaxID=7493 RepID=UPI000C71A257|nr:uncharacterized protein LOC106659378 isoform X1 [Trichogramma pretiosum]XP_023315622.1 uncharacterized protein LOC106659378 isoform X1 [Trichogramma pretiosum]
MRKNTTWRCKLATAAEISPSSVLLLLMSLALIEGAIVPPPWADPANNPCASQPRGWQLLYWPADGKCYRIFQIGAPCPETMELSPSAVGSGGMMKAECRCPPGTAQSPRDALCHRIFTRASCSKGQFFAPIPEPSAKQSSSKKRWGTCRDPETCSNTGDVFYPRDSQCYRKFSRGPCAKGELMSVDKDGLGACSCSRDGEMGKYYSVLSGGCYEFYTRGPCQEPGELFLPGGKCGCNEKMTQYHKPTNMCYELGGQGPCSAGHRFTAIKSSNGTKSTHKKVIHASCQCKADNVPYEDGLCYRTYTQGPCPAGSMLLNSTSCVPIPCKRGRLYFPLEGTCYKIGSRGPCPNGQVVLYDYSARPSIDGISYNGVCGCTSAMKNAGKCQEGLSQLEGKCDETPGMVLIDKVCHKLYTRGPCGDGEWLISRRRAKTDWSGQELVGNGPKARCECKPGYTRTNEIESNNLLTVGKCQAPSVGIARFLNEQFHIKL